MEFPDWVGARSTRGAMLGAAWQSPCLRASSPSRDGFPALDPPEAQTGALWQGHGHLAGRAVHASTRTVTRWIAFRPDFGKGRGMG